MVLPPLQQMRFRTIGLQSAAQATYGTPQQVHRHSRGQLRGIRAGTSRPQRERRATQSKPGPLLMSAIIRNLATM
jgi:hypothetical protein